MASDPWAAITGTTYFGQWRAKAMTSHRFAAGMLALLLASHASASFCQQAPPGNGSDAAPQTASSADPSLTTMCTSDEQVVFSCPIATSRQTVSMCVKTDPQGKIHLRYSSGYPGTPDLSYPAEGEDGTFTRAPFNHPGSMGGSGYVFHDQGFKYVVYSATGYQINVGGVLIQREGETKAMKELPCKNGQITLGQSPAALGATSQLSDDPDIQANGLPRTH